MSPSEWRALPWYEQRLLREGLTQEFSGEERAAGATDSSVMSGRAGEFAAAGFQETTL